MKNLLISMFYFIHSVILNLILWIMSLNTLNVIQIGRVGTDALNTCTYTDFIKF